MLGGELDKDLNAPRKLHNCRLSAKIRPLHPNYPTVRLRVFKKRN